MHALKKKGAQETQDSDMVLNESGTPVVHAQMVFLCRVVELDHHI